MTSPKTETIEADFLVCGHVADSSYLGYSTSELTITKKCACDNGGAGTCGYAGEGLSATLVIGDEVGYTGNPVSAQVTGDVPSECITFTYFDNEGNPLEGAPTDIGSYKVKMSVDEQASVEKPFAIVAATIDSISFNPEPQNYDGTAKWVTMTVKAGNLILGEGDYDITAGVLSGVVGVPSQNTVTTVTVVGKGNFQGSQTGSWTIKAPSGSFAADALKTTTAGCAVDGSNKKIINVTDSTKLVYDADLGGWKIEATVDVPNESMTSSTRRKYYTEAEVFATPAEGSGTAIKETAKQGQSITYVKDIKWTIGLTTADIEAAKGEGKTELRYEMTAYALANTMYTDGLKPTTYAVVVPIDEKLVLRDEYNQVYPELPYIAKNGNYKYLTVSNALEKAKADDTVELFAKAAAEGAVAVPVGVTLVLGSHGNAGTSYALTGSESDSGAKLVSTKEETVSAKGEGVADNFFKVVNTGFTYTLQPNHEHMWGNFEQAGNVLTATCTNDTNPCTVPGAQLAVTLEVSTVSKEYDGTGFTATLSDTTDFEAFLTDGDKHTVAVVDVEIERPAYCGTDKWYAGAYTAKCVITIDETDYTLTQGVTITKPDDGYGAGYYELKIDDYDVGFPSIGDAIAAAQDGDTVKLCANDDSFAGFTIDVGTKDITLDLNEKTLSRNGSTAMMITVNGTGTLTIKNGEIQQPYNSNTSRNHLTIAKGNVVFGDDLTLVNKYTGSTANNRFKVTAASGSSLSVSNGFYKCNFTANNDNIKISGGQFWEYFSMPDSMLAPNHITTTEGVDAGYAYKVIYHEHMMVTEIIGENTISNYCSVGGCDDATGKWATLTVTTPATYTGKAFAGATKTGELAATLEYFNGEDSLGTTVPTAVGADYKVVMSYNGKAVTNGFEITAATIDSIAFDPATPDFTGSPITTKMTVKADSLTLGTGDYDITSGSLTATGSASADTNIEVTVVGKGNFKGSQTGSWTIEAPSGSFAADAMSTSARGCKISEMDGTKLLVADSKLLEYDATSKSWKFSLKVTLPKDSRDTYNVNPASLVRFEIAGVTDPVTASDTTTLGEHGITIERTGITDIVLGSHSGEADVGSFTWTGSFTLDDVEDALRQNGGPAVTKSLTVYESSYSERVVVVIVSETMHNNGGLKPTTFTFELPIDENLVLLDENQNQVYPHVDFIAQIGLKKYDSLTNALKAAQADQTVELIAGAETADFVIPADVKVELYGFGASEATYTLDATDTAVGATLVSSNEETVATVTGFEVVTNDANEVYTYTLKKSHVHQWGGFETGGTNVLTAVCTNLDKECSVVGRAITLTLTASNVVYGTTPNFDFDATEKEVFNTLVTEGGQHTLDVGTVGYIRPAYSATKWYTGDYTAVATVTVDGVEHELKKNFAITKPQGGYTNGYEVKGIGGYDVRFDTLDEAIGNVQANGTVFYHEAFKTQQTSLEFASDKDITVDLCGKTFTAYRADCTLSNSLGGEITLANGTIRQAVRNQNYYGVKVSGKFAFGGGLTLETVGTTDARYLTVTAQDGAALAVVEGSTNGCVFATPGSGEVTVTGGVFSKDPSDFLAEGYAIGQQKAEGYPYSVIEHTHARVHTAAGNVIALTCTGTPNMVDCFYNNAEVKLTLVADDAKEALDGKPYAAKLDIHDAFEPKVTADAIEYWQGGVQLPAAPAEIGEYEARITVEDVTAVKAFRILDRARGFDLTKIKVTNAGDAACYELAGTTLTVTNGGWKYYSAGTAPDGSGIEGWYVGMTVTWPNDIKSDLPLIGDKWIYGFTSPEMAKFTVNGIKAKDSEEKRIFCGTNDIPSVVVKPEGFELGSLALTRVDTFTWYERITVQDVRHARGAGEDTIERQITAWGEKWSDVSDLLKIKFGDQDGVSNTTFKIVADLKDLELWDDAGYKLWPEHEHDWTYEQSDNSITAKCTIVEGPCRYSDYPVWAKIVPTGAAERLCDSTPLTAWVENGVTFAGATDATVGEVEYWQGATMLDAAPTQPGVYTAKAVVTLKDGVTTNELKTTLTIRAGAIVVGGQHQALEDVPNFLEKTILEGFTEDMYISVGRDFMAERMYSIPAPLFSTDFQGMKTKYFDLNGFSITAAVEQAFFENKGKLVLSDSSEGQTGRLVVNPENTGDVPLIINRAGTKGPLGTVESYGGVLTIEGGTYLGMISNEVGKVVEVLSQSIDLSGKVKIRGGKFLYRPEDSWLDDGCYVTQDSKTGLYVVHGHEHNYTFLQLGTILSATCTARDVGQGIFEGSSCTAKEVLMVVTMADKDYDGKPVYEVKGGGTLLEDIRDMIGSWIGGSGIQNLNPYVNYVNVTSLVGSMSITEFIGGLSGGIEGLLKELFATKKETFLTQAKFESMTGAEIKDIYFTQLISLTKETRLEAPPTDAGTYNFCVDVEAKRLIGSSERIYTLKKQFKINARSIADTTIDLTPNSTDLVYTGHDQSYGITVKTPSAWGIIDVLGLGKTTLIAGEDYTISGTTNATAVGSYSFTVKGIGNYTGTKTVNWQISAPTREFGGNPAAQTESERGAYATVDGTVITVSNSSNLTYDASADAWNLGLVVTWPDGSNKHTAPADAWVKLSTQEGKTYTGEDIRGGQTDDEDLTLDLTTGSSAGYVESVTWNVLLTTNDVEAAIAAGETNIVFTLTAGANASSTDPQGVKGTEFQLVIPIAILRLYDNEGNRIYPAHLHVWKYESADEGAELVATCVSAEPGCAVPVEGVAVSIAAVGPFEYDGEAKETFLENADAFARTTGATVGEIVYKRGGAVVDAAILTGVYTAEVTVVTAPDIENGGRTETYILARGFEIVKPQGGYTSGYEIERTGVCYEAFADAVAAAEAGDTIVCHANINAKKIDFTTDKDVTLDLNGKTLGYAQGVTLSVGDLEIVNGGAGTVTVINGTIDQPYGYLVALKSSKQVSVAGTFVFGEGLVTKNEADRSANYLTVTVTGGSLAVTGGSHQAKFAGEAVTITGGEFWSSFDPSAFLPTEGYMVVEQTGSYKYKVINHTHAYTYAAEGQTNIVRICVGGTDPCPDDTVSITLSIAAATVYTGNPVAATVTPSNAFDHALAYYAADNLDTPLGGAPADAGAYAVVMSAGEAAVTNGFAITPVALTSLALAEESFVCDGMPKTNAVTEVQAGAFTLTADDYTVAGDDLVQTGSAFSNVTYAVIATGKGNFTGSATNTWTILAPNGSFEEGYGDGEGYEAVPGAASVGEELTYDGKGTWYAHLEVTWPASLSAEGPSHFTPVGKFLVTPSDALVDVHTNSAPDAPDEDYVAGFTWSVAVTPEMLTAAEGDLVFTLKAMGLADEVRSPNGIAEQTFTLTVPKGTPLVDETGYQVYPAFEVWRNLYCSLDLADFGLDVPFTAKAVKAEGLPAGLKLVKTAVKDAAGKTTVGYRYAIEGVPTELMDNETRFAYVRITDAAGVQTLWPLALRVSEPEPGEDVEGTVGSPDLVIGGESNALFRVTKIWSDAEIGWTYKGWPSGFTYDRDTGYFRGTPKKAGRYTLTATSGKVGSTTYRNVRTATFTVWADAEGELSELTGQAYVAQTNDMGRFGAVKSVTGLPTGLKFTAKDVTDRTYGAIPSNTVYGLPTKAGTFAVTLTLADKSKKSFLWTIAPAVAPTCTVDLGSEADTPVERRRAQLVRGSARRYEIATSDPKATVTVTGLPSGLTLKKTAVKDAAGKTVGYTYAIEGVPTKVGESFVTVKTTLNGVTTVSTLAFTVNENPFTGLYKGLTELDGRIGVAELSAAAGGTVKLTLKEGKTTYSANVKSFEWNGTNESGRAVFLLKATSADKKANFPDREIEALMQSDGTATICDVLWSEKTCELFRTVKPTAEEMPSFTATYRFATEADDPLPLAVLAVVYDAKKATASVKGKLADGTSVSMASIAVLSNGFLAPVQAVDKSGTALVFNGLGFKDSTPVGAMSWMVEEAVETVPAYGSDVTDDPKPKFGAVVTEETTLGFAFGDVTESFLLVPNGKGGVAVYEEGTANPLLTVSSAFANGLLSFSFTSKTGDKAKYAVDLALDAESLPSGQVLRTWKDGSTSFSSGVVQLTVQQ